MGIGAGAGAEPAGATTEVGVEIRRFGKSGLKVSALCMGTMQFGWTADSSTAAKILDAAYDAGLNFIDTADVYSRWVEGNEGGVAETIIGHWMAQRRIPRDRVVLATKVRGRMGDGPNAEGLTRVHILKAVQDSLRRLGTDYIDLYQFHYPDVETPIEETLHAVDDIIRQGWVRYVGCSNFAAWRTMEALWVADRRNLPSFASAQPHYNLIHRAEYETELEDVCLQYGLAVLPYSPLAGGFLSGKYRRGEAPPAGTRGASPGRVRDHMQREESWKVMDALREVAAQKGKTPSQIALAWLLARPSVTSPIIGPRSLEQWEDNLGALDVRLTSDEAAALDRVSSPHEA
jgi:aryl-alcohol dehydrogenase-like predicted oxidoreductase